MLRIAFAGTFAARFENPVREHLGMPCDVVVADEAGIVSRLPDVDVLIALAFSREMGAVARRLQLVQVPGAGLDRIDRSALPEGVWLANVYGHETGIAEYVLGAMLALTREFGRVDAALRRGRWESQWAVGAPPPPVWPGAPACSTWKSWRSVALPSSRTRMASVVCAGQTPSTTWSRAPTISRTRFR